MIGNMYYKWLRALVLVVLLYLVLYLPHAS